jgi:glycosyltransferase involved in cell wall biosynthesis
MILNFLKSSSLTVGGLDEYISIIKTIRDRSFDIRVSGSLRFIFQNIKKIEIIHIHNIFDFNAIFIFLLSQFFRKKIIFHVHGMFDPWALKHSYFQKIFYLRVISKLLIRNVICIIALTANEKKQIAKYFNKPIVVIPNCCNEFNFHFNYRDKILNFNSSKKMYVFIGRLHHKKNLHNLLEAWNLFKYPNSQLIIAGDGDCEYVNELNNITMKNRLGNVKFVGWLNSKNKYKLLSDAHFFILPSYSEGLPIALLEALHMGVPSIISHKCNLEISKNNTGILYTSVNPKSILEALTLSASIEYSEYKRLVQGAQSIYNRNFSREVFINNLLRVYAENRR